MGEEEKVYLDKDGLSRILEKFKRTEISIPSLNQIVSYTGDTHSIAHESHVNITGEAVRAVNVGTYSFFAQLENVNEYMWSNKTDDDKEGNLVIVKADNWVRARSNHEYVYQFLDYQDNKKYIPITRKSTGVVTVNIDDSAYGSVEVIENDIVLTINTETMSGSGIITISDSGDENTNPSTYELTITYSNLPTIVSWATGTDEEINNMIKAADKGLIDLTDYWTTGDERTFALPEIESYGACVAQPPQEITMVLFQDSTFNLVNSTNSGKTTNTFCVVMKNCFSEPSSIGHHVTATHPSYSTSDTYYYDYFTNTDIFTWIKDYLEPIFLNHILFKEFTATVQAGGSLYDRSRGKWYDYNRTNQNVTSKIKPLLYNMSSVNGLDAKKLSNNGEYTPYYLAHIAYANSSSFPEYYCNVSGAIGTRSPNSVGGIALFGVI